MFLSIDFLADWTVCITILFLTGKLGVTSAFSTVYVHTAEMLPTVIRSGGVGCASTVARFGALVAPFVPLLVSLFKLFVGVHILLINGFHLILFIELHLSSIAVAFVRQCVFDSWFIGATFT